MQGWTRTISMVLAALLVVFALAGGVEAQRRRRGGRSAPGSRLSAPPEGIVPAGGGGGAAAAGGAGGAGARGGDTDGGTGAGVGAAGATGRTSVGAVSGGPTPPPPASQATLPPGGISSGGAAASGGGASGAGAAGAGASGGGASGGGASGGGASGGGGSGGGASGGGASGGGAAGAGADPGPMPADLAPLRQEYAQIMDEMVQARLRVAILGQELFRTRMTIAVQDRTGDEATLARLLLELDGTPIYRNDGELEGGEQGRQVFEGALAPGPHVLTLELEQRARDDPEYRVTQRESFRFMVVRERLTEVWIVLEDDIDIARSFRSGGEGRFEIRTRVRIATRELPRS